MAVAIARFHHLESYLDTMRRALALYRHRHVAIGFDTALADRSLSVSRSTPRHLKQHGIFFATKQPLGTIIPSCIRVEPLITP